MFQTIASLEHIDTSRISSRKIIRWTAYGHAVLESLLQRCTTWKRVPEGLEAESPKGRNMQGVRHHATVHKMNVSKTAGPPRKTLLYKRITYSENFSSLGFLDLNIPHVF